MMNPTDPYLLAFLAREHIADLIDERRHADPPLRGPQPFERLRDLFGGPASSESLRVRTDRIGQQRRRA